MPLPWQLTIIACLKPITSLFAFYACSVLFDKRHRIRGYLIIINLIACIPCFFYPYIHAVWFYTFFLRTLYDHNSGYLSSLDRKKFLKANLM